MQKLQQKEKKSSWQDIWIPPKEKTLNADLGVVGLICKLILIVATSRENYLDTYTLF